MECILFSLLNIVEYTEYYEQRITGTRGRETVGADIEMYLALWFLANTESYRQLSDRFNVTKSSVFRILHRVIEWFVNQSPRYIKWPTQEEQGIIETKFQMKKNFPKVIGAIDGSHIEISAPVENKLDYFNNRKKYYSILMQAIVDADCKFIDVYCGEPGTLHDARMFRRSPFYRKISEDPTLITSERVLLGDSAYPLTSYLITPYKGFGNLTRKQRKFNKIHSSTRVVVEKALGLLKLRFRRLKFFESPNLGFIANCVVAACVLHNICITAEDYGEWLHLNSDNSNDEDQDDESAGNAFETGVLPQTPRIQSVQSNRREELLNQLDRLHMLN